MPYVKLTTGDVIEISPTKFNGIKKTNRINPIAVHYDEETGIGFVGSQIVMMCRDFPGGKEVVKDDALFPRRMPGRPSTKKD